ncbi:MAG TPA: helix-hairpin-helix domain-containing protein, partial [Candidatus Limnocylindrales bacterium]
MPRRVARTDPPPPAAPEAELDAEEPPIRPDDPDLDPADADLQAEDEDQPRDLTNGDLARIFHEIGDMLEVKGELRFKTVAYHRAADAIGRSPIDLVAAYRDGDPPKIPGVGAAISDKITE